MSTALLQTRAGRWIPAPEAVDPSWLRRLALQQSNVLRDPPWGRPGILIVDDEEMIRTLLQIVLQRQGFVVWTAASGPEAIGAYRRHCAAIDLVLLDVRMPGLDGPQTLAALQQLAPGICSCFMSGQTGEYAERELLQRGAARVFSKPFRVDELGACLWQLAAKAQRCSA